MSAVLEVGSAEFNDAVLGSDVPVVVDFWAPWCGPCRVVGPEVEKLASEVGGAAKFVKINIDENRELAMRYNVMSIPTIAKFEGGALVGQVVGAMRAEELRRQLSLG